MAVPSWAPSLDRVANYIPRRTVVGAADGYGVAKLTFDTTTHPTDVQVTALIVDACAWVQVKTGPVHTSLADMATATAALWTAAAVEQGYPDNTQDLASAGLLFDRASAMRGDLDAANQAVTGADPEDPAAQVMPVWSFPSPVRWGDENFRI